MKINLNHIISLEHWLGYPSFPLSTPGRHWNPYGYPLIQTSTCSGRYPILRPRLLREKVLSSRIYFGALLLWQVVGFPRSYGVALEASHLEISCLSGSYGRWHLHPCLPKSGYILLLALSVALARLGLDTTWRQRLRASFLASLFVIFDI